MLEDEPESPRDARDALAETSSSSEPAAAAPASNSNMKVLVGGGLVLGIVLLVGLAFVYKDNLRQYLVSFTGYIDDLGPWGIVLYCVMYTLLELIAVPAVPLTMTAGVLFGVVPGTVAVSISATCAATLSFLIARYAARDRVAALVKGNPKFAAIDKALEKNSFQVVTLLRLSPLMPFALGNYLYGLTSVRLGPYVLGSWLGMLPGTFAYVSAGKYGRDVLIDGGAAQGAPHWQIALGLGATALVLFYIGRMASHAMKEAVDLDESESDGGEEPGSPGSGAGRGGLNLH